jgi:nicotinamide mononucleotide adenylyltransferase
MNRIEINAVTGESVVVEMTAQEVAEALSRVAAMTPSAASIKASNIKKVDADVDAIYAAAIGNRATEYSEAELQANVFKAADYTGTVPSYVASWLASNTKGLTTAQEAADDIIAQATAWRSAASAIRANRLTSKKNIIDEVPTAMQQWNGFVSAIRSALGV